MAVSRKRKVSRHQYPKNLPLRSRKALVLYDALRHPGLLDRIRNSVNQLLESASQAPFPFGDTFANGCIINSNARGSGRITVHASMGNRNSWGMNFGIARLLILGKLSLKEKDGILSEGPELSHLCGNWRCMNHDHFAVESKDINLQRMSCFKKSGDVCPHSPRCMVDCQTDLGTYRTKKKVILPLESPSPWVESPIDYPYKADLLWEAYGWWLTSTAVKVNELECNPSRLYANIQAGHDSELRPRLFAKFYHEHSPNEGSRIPGRVAPRGLEMQSRFHWAIFNTVVGPERCLDVVKIVSGMTICT